MAYYNRAYLNRAFLIAFELGEAEDHALNLKPPEIRDELPKISVYLVKPFASAHS